MQFFSAYKPVIAQIEAISKAFDPLHWISRQFLFCLLQLIYNRRSRKIPASISAIAFTLFDRFLFFFSWVIQQPCFHDVKCCLLDARGASFLTSRKKIIWLQSRSNFLDFRALLFLIWFKEQIHRRRIFLEHFCEVSRAVNLVTLHTKLAMRFISNLFGHYLLENIWREVLEENPGMQKHFFI